MTTLNTSIRLVPKTARNKRIYPGGISTTSRIGGAGSSSTVYTAGNGITIDAGEISLDTNFIEVTVDQGSKLKYNNITEFEVISGGIEIKNILKVSTVNEYTVDGGILFGSVLKVDQLNDRVGIGNSSPEYDLDVTGHCRITGSPLFGNHVYSLTDGTRDIGASGGGYFRSGYFSGNMYADDGIVINWQDVAQTIAADEVGIYTNSKFRFGDDMYSQDTAFSSGFTGAGWKLDKIGSGGSATYDFEVDSLRVRGSMTVYELILNQIRATNGSLWVSDAAKIETSDTGTTYDYDITVDVDGGTMPIPFAVNDLLRCQQFDGRNVKYYVIKVMTITPASGIMSCDVHTGASTPAAGDTLVRMGNTVTAARQNAIYLTASDSNNPYIEILSGVNTGGGSLASFSKARLGNLTGITDATFGALSGYGLWSENAYLTGKIVANEGLIADWTIIESRMLSVSGTDSIYIDATGNGTTIGRGVYMWRAPDIGQIKAVGVGQLHNKDSYNTLSSDYGFEILKRTGSSTYKHTVRLGGADNLIGGWNIDYDAIYSNDKSIGNGFNEETNGGLTLASNGAIHTPNFYIDSDGDVGFRAKEIIYAYKGVSDDLILSHDSIEGTTSKTWALVKTITLGINVQGTKTLRIKFDLQVSDAAYSAFGKIYNGDNPVGSQQVNSTTDWIIFSQDIAGWEASDEIRLYCYINGGTTDTANVRNFRVFGDQAGQVYEITGENS